MNSLTFDHFIVVGVFFSPHSSLFFIFHIFLLIFHSSFRVPSWFLWYVRQRFLTYFLFFSFALLCSCFCTLVFLNASQPSAVSLSCNSYFHCNLYVRMFVLIETQKLKFKFKQKCPFSKQNPYRQWNHNGSNLNKSISIIRFVHTFVCCSLLQNCIPKQQIKIEKMLSGTMVNG